MTMLSQPTVLNFRPERVDKDALRLNQLSMARHVSDIYYHPGFGPGKFQPDGTATGTILNVGGVSRWAAIDYPNAVTARATVTISRPSEWRSGKLALTLRYTSDGAAADPFLIGFRVDAVRHGEVLNGTSLLSLDQQLAGPAIAYTSMVTDRIFSTTSFQPDDELLSFMVARLGAAAGDVNTNHMYLLHFQVEHVPAKMEVS
jgi:hypothetical protein